LSDTFYTNVAQNQSLQELRLDNMLEAFCKPGRVCRMHGWMDFMGKRNRLREMNEQLSLLDILVDVAQTCRDPRTCELTTTGLSLVHHCLLHRPDALYHVDHLLNNASLVDSACDTAAEDATNNNASLVDSACDTVAGDATNNNASLVDSACDTVAEDATNNNTSLVDSACDTAVDDGTNNLNAAAPTRSAVAVDGQLHRVENDAVPSLQREMQLYQEYQAYQALFDREAARNDLGNGAAFVDMQEDSSFEAVSE
jgi:hypothetical protein